MDKTSRIMPQWMQIKRDTEKPFDLLKSSEYSSFKTVKQLLTIGKKLCYTR